MEQAACLPDINLHGSQKVVAGSAEEHAAAPDKAAFAATLGLPPSQLRAPPPGDRSRRRRGDRRSGSGGAGGLAATRMGCRSNLSSAANLLVAQNSSCYSAARSFGDTAPFVFEQSQQQRQQQELQRLPADVLADYRVLDQMVESRITFHASCGGWRTKPPVQARPHTQKPHPQRPPDYKALSRGPRTRYPSFEARPRLLAKSTAASDKVPEGGSVAGVKQFVGSPGSQQQAHGVTPMSLSAASSRTAWRPRQSPRGGVACLPLPPAIPSQPSSSMASSPTRVLEAASPVRVGASLRLQAVDLLRGELDRAFKGSGGVAEDGAGEVDDILAAAATTDGARSDGAVQEAVEPPNRAQSQQSSYRAFSRNSNRAPSRASEAAEKVFAAATSAKAEMKAVAATVASCPAEAVPESSGQPAPEEEEVPRPGQPDEAEGAAVTGGEAVVAASAAGAMQPSVDALQQTSEAANSAEEDAAKVAAAKAELEAVAEANSAKAEMQALALAAAAAAASAAASPVEATAAADAS
eukprot:TRINITY_DN41460_c0_g1_i1.p1 TRINITY_DN41460_c0_g1~~TRINITY_DN41460_c0_g1_i1.p1  ORF type:complete len:524 (-),score=116.88 TRINITY_DN41460_c0_g1_i1:267-1838(-)